MQVPIYLITGFLESGKTSFIQQVIVEGNFVEDEKTLLIATEEGVEEYDTDILKRFNVDLSRWRTKKILHRIFSGNYGGNTGRCR